MAPMTMSMLLEAGELDHDLAERATLLARLQTAHRARFDPVRPVLPRKKSDIWGESAGLGFYDPTFVLSKTQQSPGPPIPLSDAQPDVPQSPTAVKIVTPLHTVSSATHAPCSSTEQAYGIQPVLNDLDDSNDSLPPASNTQRPSKSRRPASMVATVASLRSMAESTSSGETPRSPSLTITRTPCHADTEERTRQGKKPPSKLRQFFSLKEPSAMALAELQATQADELKRRKGAMAIPTGKLPQHVPRVNSKWDGMPENKPRRKQKEEAGAQQDSYGVSTSATSRGHSTKPSVNSTTSTIVPMASVLVEKPMTTIVVASVSSSVSPHKSSTLGATGVKREDAAPWEFQDAPVDISGSGLKNTIEGSNKQARTQRKGSIFGLK